MILYPLPDVATRLHKSPRWLQCYLRERPFGRMAGRTRLFTESDILALIESLPCPQARQAPRFRLLVHPWDRARRRCGRKHKGC
jgi:hypothetical protein